MSVPSQWSQTIGSSLFRSLTCRHEFLCRLLFICITVSNRFTVFFESFSIIVSHQKHTPAVWLNSLSVTPKKWHRIIASKYSILLFLRWSKAVVTLVVATIVSVVAFMLITYPAWTLPCNHDEFLEPS